MRLTPPKLIWRRKSIGSAEGQPCEQGQTTASGCIAADGHGSAKKPTQKAKPKKIKWPNMGGEFLSVIPKMATAVIDAFGLDASNLTTDDLKTIKQQISKYVFDDHSWAPSDDELRQLMTGAAQQEKPSEKETAPKQSAVSQKQASAVRDYTKEDGRVYQKINKALRSGTKLPNDLEQQVKLIAEAIDAAPVLEKPIDVYRGLTFKDPESGAAFLTRIKEAADKGEYFEDPAFLSTSTDSGVASDFADLGSEDEPRVMVDMKIKARKGLKLSNMIEDTGEGEFLMQRGTKMKIVTVRQVAPDQYTVELEQMP